MGTTKFKNKVVWPMFSQFIRMRDCIRTTEILDFGRCISCGELYDFQDLEAGHYIPGRHASNLFYERGCHSQCNDCNQFLRGNRFKYAKALVKLYGPDIIRELEDNDRQYKKFTLPELEMLLGHFKTEIRRMEER